MKILLTGSSGFLGRNLRAYLSKFEEIEIFNFIREMDFEDLDVNLNFDYIIHLGGINRATNRIEFEEGNVEFTRKLIEYAESLNYPPVIIFSSSIQAGNKSDYGVTKIAAEKLISDYGIKNQKKVYILRLPNIYGKWAKPNYNSVIATFAKHVQEGSEAKLFDENIPISFLYIDDFCEGISNLVRNSKDIFEFEHLVQNLTPFEILQSFRYFKKCRDLGVLPKIFNKADSNLFSTYLSQLTIEDWSSNQVSIDDSRGSFTEVLKTDQSSQVSILRISPGSVRGKHFHNSKIEKFFVISGRIKFTFRDLFSNTLFSIESTHEESNLVDAVPGWWHSIENIGNLEAIVLIWANEVFDVKSPDTYKWEW